MTGSLLMVLNVLISLKNCVLIIQLQELDVAPVVMP